MASNLVDRDLEWNRIVKEAKKPTNAVYIGIRGQASGKTSLSTIGTYHEKGGRGGRPPKRAFIAPVIDANANKYMQLLGKIADRVFVGKATKAQGLFALGSVVTKQIKGRIRSGILPKLAESTKRAKARHGGPKVTPLIWTGRLLRSITHWLGK